MFYEIRIRKLIAKKSFKAFSKEAKKQINFANKESTVL